MSLESPPLQLVMMYQDFYVYLLPRLNWIQTVFPTATPTSWWRSESRNLAVGGAPYSQHLLGWAVDWQTRGSNREIVELANHLGLVGVDEGSHVHVQMFPAGIIPKGFFLHESTLRDPV